MYAKLTICSSYLWCWKWKSVRNSLHWKQKSVQRRNIVSNLPSVVVESGAEKRKIQKIRPIKTKENKTISVVSMATLPTVVVFSVAVNKKVEDKKHIKKIYKKFISNVAYWIKLKFNEFLRQSIFSWRRINRFDSQYK